MCIDKALEKSAKIASTYVKADKLEEVACHVLTGLLANCGVRDNYEYLIKESFKIAKEFKEYKEELTKEMVADLKEKLKNV